ncbi:hypothetical protein AB0K48_46155 [Nonomuraea sp. NPDC055795]
MRIAVAGATGNIGALTIAALEKDGHEVVGRGAEGGSVTMRGRRGYSADDRLRRLRG